MTIERQILKESHPYTREDGVKIFAIELSNVIKLIDQARQEERIKCSGLFSQLWDVKHELVKEAAIKMFDDMIGKS